MTTLVAAQRSGFPVVVATLLAVLAWILAWYWPTAEQILGIWLRSDTFAHGLAVFPVFAWLLWRKREVIAEYAPEPVPWLCVPLALAGLAWLLGRMVSVDGLAHFGLVAMLMIGFAMALGRHLSRQLAFPILFLVFALPVGEFIQPTLMHYTAEFTVFALRLSGVPVYQEGLYFVIPNGRWSVVEACSGLRYMVASLFVGSLYAYLNYTSTRRRVVFMVFAFVLPIVANWVRAYLTVMVGYLFGNEFVQGFIHIVYGWVFFGVVILLMFWIGSMWREDSVEPSVRVDAPEAPPLRGRSVTPLAIVAFAGVTAVFPLLLAHIEDPVEPFTVQLEAPAAADGWRQVDAAELSFRPSFSGHRGELFQAYADEQGQTVGLYVAYYARQREDSELISWGNRLVGSGGAALRLIRSGHDEMPVGRTVHAVLGGDLPSSQVAVWHWYWSNGRVLTNNALAKAILALDHLTGQPDDAAFVAVYARYTDRPGDVRPAVEAFLRTHGDAIAAMLAAAEVAQ